MRCSMEASLDFIDWILHSEKTAAFLCDQNLRVTKNGGAPVKEGKTLYELFPALFDEFRHARLVITDRLHGMIFAVITGTPCIVIDSKSPKVRGCYEWIKQLDYIKFIDSAEDIEKTFRQIPNKNFVYDNSLFQKYYDELGHYLISVSKKNR